MSLLRVCVSFTQCQLKFLPFLEDKQIDRGTDTDRHTNTKYAGKSFICKGFDCMENHIIGKPQTAAHI